MIPPIFIIVGVMFFIIALLSLIHYIALKPLSIKPGEQRIRARMHTYDTNIMPTNQGSSRPANNIIYPEHVDPVPQYSPPAEPSHVIIPISSSEPNSATVQMPTPSQEHIDRPPTYSA